VQAVYPLSSSCPVSIIPSSFILLELHFTNTITSYTVIDEADELMHGDWEEDMNMIMTGGDLSEDAEHHYYMFSATFPKEYRKIAKTFMADDFVRIRVGRTGSSHENIKQTIIWVEENKKRDALWDLLFQTPPCRTMIFVNNKKAADNLDDFLFNKGLPSTSIHSDRTQREREDSILSFRQGTSPILITTGVAARGLDIKHVLHVINYDLPSGMHGGLEEYVHRIGRTARIGFEGCATSFYNDRSEDMAEGLTKLLVENHQEVPDFLEDFKPLDGELVWDDDSDDEEEAAADGVIGGGWGAPDSAAVPADIGFIADAGFTAGGNSGFSAPAQPDVSW
jgi:ATP-dependent RNA helicase DDX3X